MDAPHADPGVDSRNCENMSQSFIYSISIEYSTITILSSSFT
jgi:hypothetical protein